MDKNMSDELDQDIENTENTENTDITESAALQEQIQQNQDLQMPNVSIESVIEAILFASDEPLSIDRLVSISEFTGGAKQVRQCIETLNQQYTDAARSFRIEEIAGGFQMMTMPEYNIWLKKLLRDRGDNKLTSVALETLAIIAYKQPIIRADIEAIRGVACGEMIRSLMYKGLVKIVGKAEILGRPLLYGTTKKFLEIFGLSTLKDLPKVEELKEPGKEMVKSEE
ncbi:MAG: SMC-Scp complex subunit ScpB [Phycisphaerae bacterium]|jgi:segregation and condensation protein B